MSNNCPYCNQLIFCPDCGNLLSKHLDSCKHPDIEFFFFHLLGEYQININIGSKRYGLDSNCKSNKTYLFLITSTGNIAQDILEMKQYTPIPQNKEAVELLIQRLLKLQIFS